MPEVRGTDEQAFACADNLLDLFADTDTNPCDAFTAMALLIEAMHETGMLVGAPEHVQQAARKFVADLFVNPSRPISEHHQIAARFSNSN